MRYLILSVLIMGCGSTPPPDLQPPSSAPAVEMNAPASAVSTAAASVASAPPAAPVTDPPPKHECTVFVMGDPKTAFKAVIENKQFKQEEKTSTEISMYVKMLQGDEMKRIALCDAFAKRKCPEAWRGDDLHCRMQMTMDAEAEWGSATAVPK